MAGTEIKSFSSRMLCFILFFHKSKKYSAVTQHVLKVYLKRDEGLLRKQLHFYMEQVESET